MSWRREAGIHLVFIFVPADYAGMIELRDGHEGASSDDESQASYTSLVRSREDVANSILPVLLHVRVLSQRASAAFRAISLRHRAAPGYASAFYGRSGGPR